MAPCAGVLLLGGAGEELFQSLGETRGAAQVWFCSGLLILFSSLMDGLCWVTKAACAPNEAKPDNGGKEGFGISFIKALLSVVSDPNLAPKPKQHKATIALLT